MEGTPEFFAGLRGYLRGFGLALALTLVPFGLVYWAPLSRSMILLIIGLCAVAQVVVQFRYFLHIDLSRQKREDLQLILFTGLLLLIMTGGTVLIMANLAHRMH